VRHAVDRERAGAADAFAAVVVKGDGLLAFASKVVVHDVEHLEEGGVLGNVAGFDVGEFAGTFRVSLTPDFEVEVHG
jgi:hypothetical protein